MGRVSFTSLTSSVPLRTACLRGRNADEISRRLYALTSATILAVMPRWIFAVVVVLLSGSAVCAVLELWDSQYLRSLDLVVILLALIPPRLIVAKSLGPKSKTLAAACLVVRETPGKPVLTSCAVAAEALPR